MLLNTIPDNNPAELRAFDEICGQLSGFDRKISFEWVDGFMTALNAGPQVPPTDDWLAALCGDAFERAFADPTAHSHALRVLKTRMAVLREQLRPGLLIDRPEDMRLHPLMAEWTDADRERLVSEDGLAAEDAAKFQIGARWVDGFMAGVESFTPLWPEPDADDEGVRLYADLWAQLNALVLEPGSPEMQAHLAEYFRGEPATRDDLVVEACHAVQDLRVWWVDHAPRPQTRQVEKSPGRNDPCPCGSGRKFKKCHGQA